jgi:hypothetical protein
MPGLSVRAIGPINSTDYQIKEGAVAQAPGGGPHCLDNLMDGISSESIVKFFMKHQAASANG